MPRLLPSLAFLAFALVLSSLVRALPEPDPVAAVRLVTEDLPRFWRAFDAARTEPDAAARAALYQRHYLDPGSPGLRAFDALRIGGAANLSATIDRHPEYYAALRGQADALPAQAPAIRAAIGRLKALYPPAALPDVYFLVGAMNSAGTLHPDGLLIGLDMHGRHAGMPGHELGEWHREVLKGMHELPHIVVHELVHYQQAYRLPAKPTLLQASLSEGVADFLAELASGRHINGHVHDWAEPRAAALWREFLGRKDGTDYSGWLYGGERTEGRPADLGYWMGYRIARAHYARATDKAQAIRAMLTIEDFQRYLDESGVAAEFDDAP